MRHSTLRGTLLKTAFALLFLAAGLLAAPSFMQRAYASEDECSANCRNGSCSASGACTCSCSWMTGSPICSCAGTKETEETPAPPPNP